MSGILQQVTESTDLNQRYLSTKDALRKTWNNWMRLRRKRVHRDDRARGSAYRAAKHSVAIALARDVSRTPLSHELLPAAPRTARPRGSRQLQRGATPGLSVEECVRRLKRYHYAFRRLHEIFLARLTAEPIYELKMAFSLHAHYCAEHVAALRQRVGEMREPPLGLEAVPDESLAIFFDEIRAAPTTAELLIGIYEQAVPALIAAASSSIARRPIRWRTRRSCG